MRLGNGFFIERLRYFPHNLALLRFLAKNAKKFKYHLVTRQDQNKSFPATLLSSVRKIEVILGEQEGEKKWPFYFDEEENMPSSINMEDHVAPLTPVEDPEDPKLRSPKRASNSTISEKISAKLSRNSSRKIKTSASSPSLKKAPLATADDLDPEVDPAVKASVVHRRPKSLNTQRRCHSEVTPEKTAELLVSVT